MAGLFSSSKTPTSQQATIAHGLRIQSSVAGKALPIVYGQNRIPGNLMWAGGFASWQVAMQTGSGGKGGLSGGGGKGGGGATQTFYSTSVAIGLCEGPGISVGKVWGNSSVFATPAAAGFTIFDGSYSQDEWGYVLSNFPTQARKYRGIAYAAQQNLQLGSNPQLPQYSWEAKGLLQYAVGSGILDSNPKDVIVDLLTNLNYGARPSIPFGGTTQYSNYCVANGLFLSPIIDSQEDLARIIDGILKLTNSTCVWSAPGSLTLIPYGDKTVTGNSVTFTPDLTPQYDLTDEDFYVTKDSPEPPVTGDRDDPANAYNQLSVDCVDRANDYSPASVEWKDQGSIDQFGLRPFPSVVSSKNAITTPAVGAVLAQLMGRRQLYVRNRYKFRLPIQYSRLEAGDLVTITDSVLGLNRQLVRLTMVDYGGADDEVISCESEEVNVGVAAPASYGSASTVSFTQNMNVAPGNVNTPVFVTAPYALGHGESGYIDLWIGLSGGANYGGCEIWVSDDNSTYRRVDKFVGNSRVGVTTSQINVQTDPDSTTTLGVNLSQSLGALTSGTGTDANLSNTLCYIGPATGGGELISYTTAALISANQYNLTGLRRGAYGSPIQQLPSGSSFLRCDNVVFRTEFPPEYRGRPLYFKFLAFNQFGAAMQSLADVTPYTYTLNQRWAGVSPVPTVSGLELFGLALGTTFGGRDAKFQWRKAASQGGYNIGSEPFGGGDGYPDPYFKQFKVQIYNVSTGAVLRTEYTVDPQYIYTYEKNYEDNGGVPLRTFGLLVWQQGWQNQLSPVPARIEVTNPQSGAPGSIGLTAEFRTLFVEWLPPAAPADLDINGIIINVGTTPGFTPTGTTPGTGNCAYVGNDRTAIIGNNIAPNTPYYVRCACFDTFGKDSLTYSTEISITTPQIISVDLADLSVTTTKLVDQAATTVKIAVDAITQSRIADNAVGTNELIALSVTTAKVAAAAITANEIAALTIVAGNIAAATITGSKLVAGTITATQIAAGTITTNEIASNTIVAGNIAANTITGGKIAAGTITASNIATGTITATQIAAGTITATEIAAGTITGDRLTATISMTVGSGNDVVRIDGADATYRLWVGHATASSAPFSVKKDGTVTIKSATSGARLEQLFDNIRVYDSGGTLRVKIGNLA